MTSATDTETPAVSPPLSIAELTLRWASLALAAAFAIPVVGLLARIWQRSEYFGHGYLIPLVAAFLAYTKRKAIRDAFRSGEPPPLGFIFVLAAALLQVLAIFGDVMFAAGAGIPLLIAATLYAIGGRELFKQTLLPLVFLVLMVPPPGFLINRLLFDLKFFVTKASVFLLQATGFSVFPSGNQIMVPGHTLFVADACSGLTSIVTLLPLSVIVAYFIGHGLWRRIVIVISVIPLAVGANILRVIITVFLVSSRGVEYAQGLLHETFGTATYIGGTLLLVLIARILR